MNPDEAVDFGREAILECLTLAAPVLVVAVIAAVAIGVIQSMTQIQDQSISFIPKIVLVAVTILLCLPWLADHFTDYSRELFSKPQFEIKLTRSAPLPDSAEQPVSSPNFDLESR